MVATFVSGHQFVAGEVVDDLDIHEILEGATVSSIDQSSTKTSEGFLVRVRSADTPPPDLQAREIWLPNTTRWQVTKLADGTPVSAQPYGVTFTLDASSAAVKGGQTLSPVSYDGTTLTLKVGDKGNQTAVMAVSAFDVAAGSQGVAILHGVVRMEFVSNATVTEGLAFQQSGAQDGRVTTFATAGNGYGPKALGTTLADSQTISGRKVAWCHLRR